MKKKATDTDDVHPEYDFASMKGGVRGKYVRRLRKGTNIVLIEPEIAKAFPTEAAVNEALRGVLNTTRAVRHSGGVADKALDRSHQQHGKKLSIPDDVRTEAEIAERVLSDVAQVNGLGSQVPYNCPNCGGVLWELDNPNVRRFRCHTGHSFTPAALLVSQSERIEETLWISLRMFEERKNLLNNMAQSEKLPKVKAGYARRARETHIHIERIRAHVARAENGSGHTR